MKKELLKKIIEKKEKKTEFAIITNLENGEGCIFEKDNSLDKNFEKYKDNIGLQFDSNAYIIKNSPLLVINHHQI